MASRGGGFFLAPSLNDSEKEPFDESEEAICTQMPLTQLVLSSGSGTPLSEPSTGAFSFLSARHINGQPLRFLKLSGTLEASVPSSEHLIERRFATPIHKILEKVEHKMMAEEHQRLFGFANEGQLCKRDSEGVQLWVDKYRPAKYTELITMDSCNLDVLRWVKQWDEVRERFGGDARTTSKSRMQPERKRDRSAGGYSDPYNRPEKRILLLHGPPGLGKTTLAHIAAEAAGYSVVEINASDERTGNVVINKISAALEVQSVFNADRKPNLVVIDEIDGAAAAGNEQSLIRFLVKLGSVKAPADTARKASPALGRDNGSADEEDENEREADGAQSTVSKSKTGKKASLLIRPIICICNDLYVPALRPLRQVAHIVQVKPLGPAQLSLRLRSICNEEDLKVNARSLVELAEVMDSDIRSCLNALQFTNRKQRNQQGSAGFEHTSFKDTIKTPLKVYEAVYQNSQARHLDIGSRKHSELVETVWTSATEYDRLMTGCFEIYPQAKFFDNSTLDKVNQALEVFSHFDVMSSRSESSASLGFSGRLDGYLVYKFAELKRLFGSPVHFKLKYPKQDYENYLKQAETKNVLKDYTSTLPPTIRSVFSRTALLTERIPALMATLNQFSLVKSSNPQLMRPEDRSRIGRIVNVMLEEGLIYQQTKESDGPGYRFILEPPINRICAVSAEASGSTESLQDSHTYAVCRLVSSEIETAKIKRQKSKASGDQSSRALGGSAESPASNAKRPAAALLRALPQASKKIAKDFFGRPIAVIEDQEDSSKQNSHMASKDGHASSKNSHINYIHNDGVSNAVRRSIKVSSFFS